MSLLLTSNKFRALFWCSIVDFEQENDRWKFLEKDVSIWNKNWAYQIWITIYIVTRKLFRWIKFLSDSFCYSVKWYFKLKTHWKLVVLSSIFLCVFITQYVLMLPTYSNIFRYPASGSYKILKKIDPLSANPTKWSKTLKQVVGFYRRIVCVCSTILWGWCLKG